jgi:peptide subunit release factor 1 (eRF1)
MIPREELQELADFWTEHKDAISFYYAPGTPTELAHREEPILTKEKIQQVFGSLHGGTSAVRADIERLLDTTAEMRGNHAQSKVIFACGRERIWREYNLDAKFPLVLECSRSFAIASLAKSLSTPKRYCIALADRNRSRLLLLKDGKILEQTSALDEELDPELDKVRTTGTGGSSHVERQREEMVRHHFEFLASHLLHFYEQDNFDALLIGCRDAMWPEIEGTLHNELKRILVGHFRVDPGLAKPEEVQACAQPLIDAQEEKEEQELVESAVAGAAADGLGAVGLPSVISSLDKGEVRMLLWTPQNGSWQQPVSMCTQCGHLWAGSFSACELCGQPARAYAKAEEGLVRAALSRGVELKVLERARVVPSDEVAALLRFRSDHNTPQALAS